MIGGALGWQFAYVLVAGVLATYFWRALGVLAASGIDEKGELFRWVRAVSTALIAALVARLVLFAPGALDLIPLWLRLGALGAGFAVYAVGGRHGLVAGIVTGEALLVAGAWLYGIG